MATAARSENQGLYSPNLKRSQEELCPSKSAKRGKTEITWEHEDKIISIFNGVHDGKKCLKWRMEIATGRKKFFTHYGSQNIKLSDEHVFAQTTRKTLSLQKRSFISESHKLKIHKVHSHSQNASVTTFPYTIYLAPLTVFSSKLDNRYQLSEWLWGVTLIVTKGSTDCGSPQHAQLGIVWK